MSYISKIAIESKWWVVKLVYYLYIKYIQSWEILNVSPLFEFEYHNTGEKDYTIVISRLWHKNSLTVLVSEWLWLFLYLYYYFVLGGI